MNWPAFFKQYRERFGSIKNSATVAAITAIVEANKEYKFDTNQLAYLLATAYHETAHDFIPKREFGSAEYFIRKYWENTKLRAWLGNDSPEEAVKYCGRGLVQITGEVNYEKFGIAQNPDKALELETSIRIIYVGMRDGVFTGRKLSYYVNDERSDYFEARRVINGMDRAAVIADYANGFYQILKSNLP